MGGVLTLCSQRKIFKLSLEEAQKHKMGGVDPLARENFLTLPRESSKKPLTPCKVGGGLTLSSQRKIYKTPPYRESSKSL